MENTKPNAQALDDYRTTMQQAAAAFIKRHEAEHLHDDGLFDRTVRYLVTSLEVPAFMAERLVHLAMTERMPKGKAWVGVDMAAGPDQSRLLILDRRIGQTMLLPCRHLPGRFLAHQNTR